MAGVPSMPSILRVASEVGTTIKCATPVRGQGEWFQMAKTGMWLAGKGSQLVSFGPYMSLATPGAGFPCYTVPHLQNLNWVWILSLALSAEGAHVSGHFDGAQATTLGEWTLDSSRPRTPQHFIFYESFESMSSPYTFAPAVYIDSDEDDAVMVGLSACELPMREITAFGSASTPVVDPTTCANSAPIFEPGSGRKSANGLMRIGSDTTAGLGLIREARRNMLFSWSNPQAAAVTSSSYSGSSPWFTDSPSVVARHSYLGTNTATVRVAVYAGSVGAPNTGDIRITPASGGAALTLSITAGAFAWYTGNLTVETEDLSRNATDGGLRGGTRETLLVEARTTGGTTSIQMTSMFVVEVE